MAEDSNASLANNEIVAKNEENINIEASISNEQTSENSNGENSTSTDNMETNTCEMNYIEVDAAENFNLKYFLIS